MFAVPDLCTVKDERQQAIRLATHEPQHHATPDLTAEDALSNVHASLYNQIYRG